MTDTANIYENMTVEELERRLPHDFGVMNYVYEPLDRDEEAVNE